MANVNLRKTLFQREVLFNIFRVTSGSYGQSGIIRSSGFLGNAGAQPRISFTQDFSKIRGQSQQYVGKPRVQSFNRVSSPVAVSPVIGSVAQ